MGEMMMGKKLTLSYISVCIVGIDAVRKYFIKFDVFMTSLTPLSCVANKVYKVQQKVKKLQITLVDV